MALVYFHPGALVHLCTATARNDLAAALWDGADLVATSRASDLEVRTVLAGGLRLGKLGPQPHQVASQRWTQMRAAMWQVELSTAVTDHAGELAEKYPVRPTDALQLASAELMRCDELLVLGWGEHFVDAARAEGFTVLT